MIFTVDTLMKELTVPITELLDAYKNTFRSLHPFEATVAGMYVLSLSVLAQLNGLS